MGQAPRPDLPAKAPGESATHVREEFRFATFAGPLPPPAILKAYDEACPGAADRLIAMAERQSKHRQDMESAGVAHEGEFMRRGFDEARVGQVCAFLIAVSFIAAGVYVISSGHTWEGTILGGGGVTLQALVMAFLRDRRSVPIGNGETKQPSEESRRP